MPKPLTLALAKTLGHGDYLCHMWLKRADRKRPISVRVNGRVQVWKRSPERVRVPWKYGLYEYGAVTEANLGDWYLCRGDGEGTPLSDNEIAKRLLERSTRVL